MEVVLLVQETLTAQTKAAQTKAAQVDAVAAAQAHRPMLKAAEALQLQPMMRVRSQRSQRKFLHFYLRAHRRPPQGNHNSLNLLPLVVRLLGSQLGVALQLQEMAPRVRRTGERHLLFLPGSPELALENREIYMDWHLATCVC